MIQNSRVRVLLSNHFNTTPKVINVFAVSSIQRKSMALSPGA